MISVNIGSRVPRRQNRIMRRIGLLYFKMSGWRLIGDLPDLPKFVFIGAPHNSNWDFLLAMAFLFTLELRVYWLAKQEFIEWPVSAFEDIQSNTRLCFWWICQGRELTTSVHCPIAYQYGTHWRWCMKDSSSTYIFLHLWAETAADNWQRLPLSLAAF